MINKYYKRWLALGLSAAVLAGNFGGFNMAEAADVTGKNLIENPGFENDKTGWDFGEKGAGVASNNKHSGKKHFFIDGATEAKDVYEVSQEIKIPADGVYQTSLWAACGGKNGTFGVRKADGTVLSETVLSGGTYTQYTISEGLTLKKGDVVEVYVKEGTGWINGDDFEFVCTEQTGSTDADYIFEGNMVENGDFNDGVNGWTIKAGGTANNNGYPSNDTHYYLNGNGSLEQEIEVPYTGTYKASTWVSASGKNGVFGVKNADGEVIKSEKLASQKEYKHYELEFDLEKGDKVTIFIQGTNGWTNGDKFSLTFDKTGFGNMLINSDFKTDEEWTGVQAEIGSGKAILKDAASEIEQDFYVPVAGPYIAEVVLENAENATVSLGESEKTKINGGQTVTVQLADLQIGDKVTAKVSGKATVKSFTVKFDTKAFDNTLPTASEVKIDYESEEEDILAGSYMFADADKHVEGPTTYKWYAADAREGEYTEIPDAVESTYQVEEEYKNKYIKFEVIPVDEYQGQGEPVRSEAFEPVALNIKRFTTNPTAYETKISAKNRTIHMKYYYETDLSSIQLEEMKLVEGVESSVKTGESMDLTKEFKFKVKAGEGKEAVWTVTAEEAEKKVVVRSSNKYLEDTFNWAAQKQRQFVMTGKTGPINVPQASGQTAEYIPSYWAGYYDRTAFYTRDFVHQATGGQIAGLEEENFSMFKAFAKECTEERQWYTVWALNFDGSIYTMDYHNANSFVREVPAQFELVEKAYKQYMWSGDRRYIEDETLWNFYTNVMTKYADSHDANANGVVQEVGTGIFNGSCTYNERGRHIIESGDAIGSQYQATLAYAAMLEERGDTSGSKEWYQKAEELKKYFNEEWSVSDKMDSEYVCAWGPNGEKYSDFSKETSWFMPMKLITEPGERNDAYIDFVLENLGEGIGDPNITTEPNNLEAYTYIPDMLFPYNRSDDAWKWMKYITSIKDEPHERPIQGTNGDYPEISFTFVSHTIEGMMGVEPDAANNFIATVPRLPQEVPDVTADHIDIADSELSLTHVGNTSSALTNTVGPDLTWEVRFYGEHNYIKIGNEYVEAQQKELNGEVISYTTVTVPSGKTVHAEVASKEDAENAKAAADVDAKIDAIGEVTLDSKDAIDEARTAYEALNEKAKGYVTKLNVLKAAEEKYELLLQGHEEMVKAAEEVERLIANLGEITLDSKDAVAKARAAYGALSGEAKALVTNLDVLEAAEAKIKELEELKDPADSDTQKPEKPNDTDPEETVNTGDDTSVSLLGMAMLVLGIFGFIEMKKRRS